MCSDIDFQAALSMVKVLVKHSGHVFSELPKEVKVTRPKDRKEQFLDKLKEKFSHTAYSDLAKSMSIEARTADRYIASFCEKGLVCREQYGMYTNLTLAETKNDE